jgi:probable HAF family extracellular repeat protein
MDRLRVLALASFGMILGDAAPPAVADEVLGFLDNRGSFTTIAYPGASATEPLGINDEGQIVGDYFDATGIIHAFLYSSGSFVPLVPGPNYSDATGINNSGQIVGDSNSTESSFFVYTGGTFTMAAYPGAIQTIARGINNAGEVVGSYFDGNDGNIVLSFLYTGGSFATIDYPGAITTVANGINDTNQIVGLASGTGFIGTGFLFSNGSFTAVNFPGAGSTELTSINDSGQIVGSFYTPSGSGSFLYSGGGFTQINVPGGYNASAWGINGSGEIVGYYDVRSVPEAPALPALAFCLLGIAAIVRRNLRHA